MYFNDKGNTDIDQDLKYDGEQKKKDQMKDLLVYAGLGVVFLIGIVLIIIGIGSYL